MCSRKANGLRLAGLLSGCLIVLGLTYGLNIRIPCPFKALTGVPCPGCGGMRALDALLEGDIRHALSVNPLSLLLIAALAAVCLWLTVDLILGRNTFSEAAKRTDDRYVISVVVLILLAGWCRNIFAGV